MRYYIKIFNAENGNLVGFYKQTGKSCISKLMNGIKYFDNIDEALDIAFELDDGFLRDKDKHYYRAFTCVYGDHTKERPKVIYKTKQEKESELADELETFIRKNSSRNR